MVEELLFLLLPVAALSGWVIGRKRSKGKTGSALRKKVSPCFC